MPPLKYDQSSLVFGPVDGTLVHEPDDGFLEEYDGPDVQENVLIEATFLNPYTSERRYWEHGFLLKDRGRNNQYWCSFDSDGFWQSFHRLGNLEEHGRHSEESHDIDRRPGGKNLLQIVVIGDRGWVYINGEMQGGLDLSADTGGDGITLFIDDEHAGETRFEDFAVWKWSPSVAASFSHLDPNATPTPTPTPNPKVPIFGPVSGTIPHDSEDGFLEEFDGPSTQSRQECQGISDAVLLLHFGW